MYKYAVKQNILHSKVTSRCNNRVWEMVTNCTWRESHPVSVFLQISSLQVFKSGSPYLSIKNVLADNLLNTCWVVKHAAWHWSFTDLFSRIEMAFQHTEWTLNHVLNCCYLLVTLLLTTIIMFLTRHIF